MEYERYDEGLTYRYVYGVDKLGVTAYTIANGSASVTTDAGEIPLYYDMAPLAAAVGIAGSIVAAAIVGAAVASLKLLRACGV